MDSVDRKNDREILFELMKNSHRSDRQIAAALNISQPTMSRHRDQLEKGIIEGYTVIPKFDKIGFEIAAFTFLKSNLKDKTGEKQASFLSDLHMDVFLTKLKDWYLKQPNVIWVLDGYGMGWDVVCLSLHENFAGFSEFIRAQNFELSEYIVESQSFLSDLKSGTTIKSFHFKYLAEKT